MSTAAARMRAYRQRVSEGAIVLSARADETKLVHALIVAKQLDPLRADDREAIDEAFQKVVDLLCTEKENENL